MSSNPPALSADLTEKARKAHSTVLRRLQEPGRQAAIATVMGVSESTVSRLKNDCSEQFCMLLSCAGLKIVASERVCVDPETYRAMAHIAGRAMQQPDVASKLLWEDDE